MYISFINIEDCLIANETPRSMIISNTMAEKQTTTKKQITVYET